MSATEENVSWKNRRLRQDALRNQLHASEYLRQLEEIDTLLRTEWKTIKVRQQQALRLRVEVNRIRLAKCLPDLKSTDVNISRETGVTLQTNAHAIGELFRQLARDDPSLLAHLPRTIDGEVEQANPQPDLNASSDTAAETTT
jgi:hypothetical protein